MEIKVVQGMTYIAAAVLGFIVIFALIHYFDDGNDIEDEWR